MQLVLLSLRNCLHHDGFRFVLADNGINFVFRAFWCRDTSFCSDCCKGRTHCQCMASPAVPGLAYCTAAAAAAAAAAGADADVPFCSVDDHDMQAAEEGHVLKEVEAWNGEMRRKREEQKQKKAADPHKPTEGMQYNMYT